MNESDALNENVFFLSASSLLVHFSFSLILSCTIARVHINLHVLPYSVLTIFICFVVKRK